MVLDVEAFESGLSVGAARSRSSRGRALPEEPCRLRTEYQRDRDRILHCKAFRRLKHKTQVFIAPEGDHYRTRLTHTLEVAGIARAVARGLRLNEDLTEAIALGHDLGHTPFGHAGEDALDSVLRELGYSGFRHNEQSARVVECVENDGRGLNLTWEVRDGIARHTGTHVPSTLEGCVVRACDRVAYVNHDLDDAIRSGLITPADIPRGPVELLGGTGSERIDYLAHDLVDTSHGRAMIEQGPEAAAAMNDLRDFLFHTVYTRAVEVSGEDKVRLLLRGLFHHFLSHPEHLPATPEAAAGHTGSPETVASVATLAVDEALVQRITDHIAGMTDRFAMRLYFDIFVPRSWSMQGRS
ncbi:MAG: deoxyguanosinetriphosphate triphosphohydrolase [Actinobacteria bacterium]|nr:deoxyguanosinetriphosphate triphosphohydrolase [Actinomycetota bacterium]